MSEKCNGKICAEHGHSFSRVHDRIDKDESDMRKVKATIYGDPEKGIEGLVQTYNKFTTEMKIYSRALIFILSAAVLTLITAVVKGWIK